MANPARGLLNRKKRTKEKVWQHTPPPPPPYTTRSETVIWQIVQRTVCVESNGVSFIFVFWRWSYSTTWLQTNPTYRNHAHPACSPKRIIYPPPLVYCTAFFYYDASSAFLLLLQLLTRVLNLSDTAVVVTLTSTLVETLDSTRWAQKTSVLGQRIELRTAGKVVERVTYCTTELLAVPATVLNIYS